MVVNILTHHNMINNKLVSEVLNYLEEEGWSELIDPRWETEVKNDILKKYSNIDEETLFYILKIVLY